MYQRGCGLRNFHHLYNACRQCGHGKRARHHGGRNECGQHAVHLRGFVNFSRTHTYVVRMGDDFLGQFNGDVCLRKDAPPVI